MPGPYATDFDTWYAGAAFADETGRPVVWHHGTTEDEFNVFTRWDEASIGFHFGTPETARSRLDQIEAEDGRVLAVHCRAKRPLRLRDHHMWGLRNVLGELEELGIVTADEAEQIYDDASDAAVFAAIERAGYDCIVYANDTEGGGDSLLVWRAELLKATDATSFDISDPRLRPDLPASDTDLQAHARLAAEIDAARRALDAIRAEAPSP